MSPGPAVWTNADAWSVVWCNQNGLGLQPVRRGGGRVSVGPSSSRGCTAWPAGFVVAHVLTHPRNRCLSSMQRRQVRKD